MKTAKKRGDIIDLLINKAALKQDIADYSESVLASFKRIVQKELAEITKSIDDKRVRLKYEDKGKFEFIVYIGSDALVFQLHTNVFRFADDNPLWESSYLKENGANGYFAIINIYNFLAESFEQNRINDAGYLIGRVFLNHDSHFMVEGQGNLGTLFNNLAKGKLTDLVILKVIQAAMAYAIEFDLITPPYDLVEEVSLGQIREISSDLQVATGKRLGFRFSAEDKDVF